jgi:hypothetical protein
MIKDVVKQLNRTPAKVAVVDMNKVIDETWETAVKNHVDGVPSSWEIAVCLVGNLHLRKLFPTATLQAFDNALQEARDAIKKSKQSNKLAIAILTAVDGEDE